MIADLIFYMFATVLLIGGLGVITAKNPMYCVLFMVLTFFNAAGLFILIGAEFIGLMLVMIYVGAIAVMFLFVLMTININFAVLKDGFANHLPIGVLIAGVLAVELVFSILGGAFSKENSLAQVAMTPDESKENIVQLGEVLFTNYAYPFLSVSMILLVAMIGAIILTHRRRPNVKRQDVAAQIARKREDSITLVSPKVGKGLSE